MQQPSDFPSHSSLRQRNLELLNGKGFLVASSLPARTQEDAALLRPIDEIVGRLAALNAIFVYVAAPESAVPTARLFDHVRGAELHRHMTLKEAAIFALDRTAAGMKHGSAIGWRTENAVALAWVLGRECELSFDGTMLDGDQIRPLVTEWPPMDGAEIRTWAARLQPRAPAEVAAMEDLFYCAHNATRSAQVAWMETRGKSARPDTVPMGFDPVVNGGVICERRHSLTWALSPGIDWDDTDLST